MPEFVTFLTFNDQAEEAANFYTSIFPDSKITKIARARKAECGPEAGKVITVAFELSGGMRYVALNGGPHFSFSEGNSILVECDTQAEVDEYWSKLTADGGVEQVGGWLVDKFGVSWQINPKIFTKLIDHDDPEIASKAMASVLKMKKVDGDEIQRACGLLT